MVSVCLPSDALLQHLPSYLGFSYLGRAVSLQGCSSKAQPLLLTWDEGYLLPPPFLGPWAATTPCAWGLLLLVATLALGATPGLRQSAYQILALQLSPHPPAPPTCTPNKRSNHLSSRTKPLSILSTFYSSTVPVSEVNERSQVSQSFSTLCDPMDCSLTRFLRPWDFPGKNTGVGCHFLLQKYLYHPQLSSM